MTVLILLITIGGFGVLLYNNAGPSGPTQVIIPTESEPTSDPDTLARIFSEGLGSDSTPLPTIAIPTERFVPPTLPPAERTSTGPVRPTELGSLDEDSANSDSVAATPTPIPPTPTIPVGSSDSGESDEGEIVQMAANQPTREWQPPPLPVPQSRDPQGRDHYIFARPVDSNANNYGLFYYPYGANGQQQLSISRIHHGLDFSNPVGTTVRAAGSGTVIFASTEEEPYYPGSPSYGQTVIIEHDFSWDNQPLWTVYAHLERPLVEEGATVEMNDPIALSGNSGRSSGPHLHFEVRMGGEGNYGATYNPGLWIVPYVGHGTIAGSLVDRRGEFVDDVTITARNLSTGKILTTTTYTFSGTINEVNSDPNWNENFVIGDVPNGRYVVIADYNGRRISEVVQVYEGVTSFVELQPVEVPTPQPVEPTDES